MDRGCIEYSGLLNWRRGFSWELLGWIFFGSFAFAGEMYVVVLFVGGFDFLDLG